MSKPLIVEIKPDPSAFPKLSEFLKELHETVELTPEAKLQCYLDWCRMYEHRESFDGPKTPRMTNVSIRANLEALLMAYSPNTRPRITTLALPCRWYAPGKFANNPNWELRTLCEDYFLAEILQDGPHFFACIMGVEVPEIPFTTAHLAKIWCETFLTDPSNFK